MGTVLRGSAVPLVAVEGASVSRLYNCSGWAVVYQSELVLGDTDAIASGFGVALSATMIGVMLLSATVIPSAVSVLMISDE